MLILFDLLQEDRGFGAVYCFLFTHPYFYHYMPAHTYLTAHP